MLAVQIAEYVVKDGVTRDFIEHEEEEEKFAISILKHKESFEKQ